jgi:hypothetical protein
MLKHLALGLVLASSAWAEPDYSDDRSTPEAVVASLYNAISRHEFARAWSYFADGRTPDATFEAFRVGYEDTRSVEILTGQVQTEGAAGSIFATVPVALAAVASDRTVKVFAGCYLTRQVQPALQEPPFRGIEIVAGHLVARTGPLPDSLPRACDADARPSF